MRWRQVGSSHLYCSIRCVMYRLLGSQRDSPEVFMNWILWILVGAITGWLESRWLGEKGYGKVLSANCARGMDTLFGLFGAAIGCYTLFGAVIDRGNMLSHSVVAALCATALVGFCRLMSERYFRSPSYRGMSRATFIEWHDTLTEKELAGWKLRRAQQTRAKSPSA